MLWGFFYTVLDSKFVPWDNSSKFIMELSRQFDKFISQAIFQQSVQSKKQYPSADIVKGICEPRI